MSKDLTKQQQAAPAPAQTSAMFDTRKVVTTLEGLMTKVTEKEVTPETVNAACNCADKIVDFLRVHLDVERLNRRTKGL